MINTIIFDIGNVLAAFDWENNLRRFGFPEEEYEAIADAVYRSSDWNEMDRGVLTLEELTQRFCRKEPQYASDIKKVIMAASGMIRQYPYTKPMIRMLKEKGYRVYYLSNYGEFVYEETKDQLDFTELMDGGLFSYEVKMIKPNPWIYEELLERYGIKPEEAIFFDDNLKNVEAANKRGILGIQFQGYDEAMKELKRLGMMEMA